jgi:hypothetical protein
LAIIKFSRPAKEQLLQKKKGKEQEEVKTFSLKHIQFIPKVLFPGDFSIVVLLSIIANEVGRY